MSAVAIPGRNSVTVADVWVDMTVASHFAELHPATITILSRMWCPRKCAETRFPSHPTSWINTVGQRLLCFDAVAEAQIPLGTTR